MTENSLSKPSKEKIVKFCDDQIKSQLIRIDFYKEKKEKELMYIAYIGLAEEYLNNILYTKENKEYQKEMIKQYNKIVGTLLKSPVSIKRKMRYIVYRLFMKQLFINRH